MDRAFNILACYSPGLFSILLVGVQNERSGTILFVFIFLCPFLYHTFILQTNTFVSNGL